MKGNELLLEAIGGVDPALVEDARSWDGAHRRTGRRALTLALAAALVLALSATAYAWFSGADWFKGWFADRSGGLTASQEAYIDANAADIGQSATANGWTVTVRSALADQYDFCILLRIDPPAGTKLDGDSGVIELGDLSIGRTDGADRGAASGMTGSVVWSEEDGDLTAVWTQGITARQGSDFSYLDGAERTVRLERLHLGPDRVIEGPWAFTLTLPTGGGEAAELAPEPVPCQGERLAVREGQGYERQSLDMTLTSLRLTALGAVAKVEYDPDTREKGTLLRLPVTVVLADGTEIRVTDLGGAYEDSQAELRYQFSSPIVLPEVDHVLLPGGVTLPMPE